MKKKHIVLVLLFIVSNILNAQYYKKIVSLAPSVTQSIYSMGGQDLIVGCTNYCKLAKKDKKQIVSSAIKPNIEKIVRLSPDLVIASGLTNPKDIATLERLGIKVVVYQTPKSFNEICSQFVELGELIGKKDKAVEIVESSSKKIKEIINKSKWKSPPSIFFQIGSSPIFSVVDNTFMSDYISFLGGTNIASGLDGGVVSREFVLSKNPNIIIITTMGVVGEKERQIWSKYRQLDATKTNSIYIVESEIACQPTPLTFVQTVEELYLLLSKQLMQ
ncbi:MAG: hypothetical protein CSA89_00350 [Bacteroidales bacterium]|nr:MAG: hypothetical protein CSA89_00350 [Bacteroidales bacterium]